MYADSYALILALLQSPPGGSVWPVTVSGWVTLIIAVLGVAGGILAAGKFLGTLNGFGVRLTDLEKAHEKAEGERATMQRQVDRVLDQHELMIERLGESKRSAEKCSEETVDLGIAIGAKIDSVARDVNSMNLQLSQRIKAVETVLKIRGDA